MTWGSPAFIFNLGVTWAHEDSVLQDRDGMVSAELAPIRSGGTEDTFAMSAKFSVSMFLPWPISIYQHDTGQLTK